MFYYSFHVNDYRAATAHLTNGEDLAYRRLLDLYYETEEALPADWAKLARLVRCPQKDVETVLEEFFDLADGRYQHGRCERELANMMERAEIARQNGSMGGRPRKITQRVSPANPVGTQQEPAGNPLATQVEPGANPDESYPSTPVPQDPSNPGTTCLRRTRSSPSYTPDFEKFWEAYGKRGSKVQSFASWKRLNPTPELAAEVIAKAKNYRDSLDDQQFQKHAERWVRDRCWEGVIVPRSTAPKLTPNGRPVVEASTMHIPNMPLGHESCNCAGCAAAKLTKSLSASKNVSNHIRQQSAGSPPSQDN